MLIKAHGKLLISGEYLVLDGALALAIPCQFGQEMQIQLDSKNNSFLHWQSVDHFGNTWFEGHFDKNKASWIDIANNNTSNTLQSIFKALATASPDTWQKVSYIEIKSNFPLEWGLGSSSTLLYLLGRAFDADAYMINKNLFQGSGYDIACAGAKGPILYKLMGEKPHWELTNWNPSFHDKLYFVYLGKKQSSKDEINRFQKVKTNHAKVIDEISNLSKAIAANQHDARLMIEQLQKHEDIMSEILGKDKIQNTHFKDFRGVVKSLGAWGGDFVLAASVEENMPNYFSQKGYKTFLPFNEMSYVHS
jgi:mevalonate kinase